MERSRKFPPCANERQKSHRIVGVPIEGMVAAGASGDQSFVVASQEIEVEGTRHDPRP
jgi:hypothetical protein